MQRILIIDDDSMVRRDVSHALSKDGHEVLEASEPFRGISLAKSERPDLILLDVLMPGMDGICVLRQLRDDPATSSIPVIMVTSLGSKDQVAACLEEGAIDHIKKPFSHEVLRTRVSANVVSNEPGYQIFENANIQRILIIDDDSMVRRDVNHALSKDGHEVLEASEPLRGISLAKSERPDLILLDVLMPGMDGICVLRQLRDDPATSSIPVIMVTSLDSKDQVAACLEEGANDHIKKPFSHEVLRTRVSACFLKVS